MREDNMNNIKETQRQDEKIYRGLKYCHHPALKQLYFRCLKKKNGNIENFNRELKTIYINNSIKLNINSHS